MSTTSQQLPAVIQAIAPIVNQYGYLAVGGLLLMENFGIPVPGETVLIAAAVFAGLGKLNIVIVIIVGVLFSILGDNIGFAIGRYGGHPLLAKYGKYIFLTKKRIAKTIAFYDRNGAKIILVARFIDGLRQTNGIIAGITDMKWPKFVLFNSIGAAVWVLTWSLIGYLGAGHAATLLRYQLYLSITLVAGAIAYFLYKRYKAKSASQSE
jgi:membrane protein DedA with SNARE-associated domain